MQRAILDEDNDFGDEGPQLGEGLPSAKTALQAIYSIQRGEWGYNHTIGMPWRNGVFGKYFDAGGTLSIVANIGNSIRELVPFPDIFPITAAQITLDTVSLADARQVDISIANVTATDTGESDDITLPTTV